MKKIELKLFRLKHTKTPQQEYTQEKVLLEIDSTLHSDLNRYFIGRFRKDANGGIDSALEYVKSQYGGGNYLFTAYIDNTLVYSSYFALVGFPK